jgi:Na+/H+ antiporter NhaD/arsenite permease-like protein
MVAGMVLGFIWVSTFLMACNDFAVICASITWYFSRKDIADTDGIPGDADVWKGFLWTYRYHTGTLALGSFMLTVIALIRGIFNYVAEKMYKASGNNGCTKCLIGCINCCLACFDKFCRYLT